MTMSEPSALTKNQWDALFKPWETDVTIENIPGFRHYAPPPRPTIVRYTDEELPDYTGKVCAMIVQRLKRTEPGSRQAWRALLIDEETRTPFLASNHYVNRSHCVSWANTRTKLVQQELNLGADSKE